MRYLLQGLLVCGKCGYAYYGKPLSVASMKREDLVNIPTIVVSARCVPLRWPRVCDNKQCRTDLLDQAVWRDVCAFPSHPSGFAASPRVALAASARKGVRSSERLTRLIGSVRRGITRLIDAYQDGFLEREEFEPRIREAKERLTGLEAEAKVVADQEAEDEGVREAIGRTGIVRRGVRDGLQDADWGTRREILLALLKKVEVGADAVRIEYRAGPRPFDRGPRGGHVARS